MPRKPLPAGDRRESVELYVTPGEWATVLKLIAAKHPDLAARFPATTRPARSRKDKSPA
jgi:hypothetical protein